RGITASQEEIDKAIQELYGFFPNGTATPTITPTEYIFPTLSSEQLAFFPATSTPTTVPTSTTAPSNNPDPAMTATATFTAAPPTPTFVPEAATATATPYTLEGFNEQYAKALEDFKTNGISEGTLRSLYTTNILRDKLLKELSAGGPQTEEQVWARHILVEDERSLGIVRSLLASGRDFGEVARKYSVDTGSGANGGDLGWFGRGAMVPEFEEAAFSQEIGEIGEPVKSQFGYHIIQVIAHQELPVAQSQQSQDNALSEWVVKAREESTITINEAWREQIPPLPAAFGQAQPN
ncbi:MAG TPA: peptidylprolyl isomerase, partial [Anaerolineales bacterium]|nr:peptidylprolyl isomerase [Anaerolineales bacterium]